MSTTTYASKDASALLTVSNGSYDAWAGNDRHNPVGVTVSGTYKTRSFLYFPLSFTGLTAVTSAVLWLRANTGMTDIAHCIGNTASKTMYVNLVTASWDEGAANAENTWSANQAWNWTNRASAYAGTAIAKVFSTGLTDGAWYSIDITPIVQLWAPPSSGGSGLANYGIILRNSNESSSSAGLEFWSTEKGTGYKPYVVLTGSTNTVPNAPNNANSTPGTTSSGAPEVVSGLTPTFTGVFTDPDAGDTITAVQVLVYSGTTQSSLCWDSGAVATSNVWWSVPYGGSALAGNSTYNWIARVRDASGAWSTSYSSPLYFKPNSTPLSPSLSLTESPTGDVLTLTPTFNITHNDPDVTDNKAYGYSLTIERSDGSAVASTGDIGLGTPITTVSVLYGTGSLTGATALVPGQSYRWRAKTKDSNGAWSSLSGYATFTVHATGSASSLSPTASATVTTQTPVFSGQRANGNDTLTEVTVEVYASTNLSTPADTQVQTTGVTAAGFSFTWPRTLATSTSYFWRVRAKTAVFGYGPWTTLSDNSFAIDTTGVLLALPTTNDSTTQRVTSQTPTLPVSRAVPFRYYSIEVRDMAGTLAYFSGEVDYASSVTSLTRVYGVTTLIGSGGTAASVPLASLAWNTQYQWRARVSNTSIADLHSLAYGSYATFWTDAAGIPILSGPNINSAWTTTTNPVLTLGRAGSDLIAQAQVIVYQVVNGAWVQVWDSGFVSFANVTSASITYGTGGSGEYPSPEPALVGGYVYVWLARYIKSTGPVGNYSAGQTWYQNAAPSMPTSLSPASGAAVSGINPVFTAAFEDADIITKGDTPSEWTIVIQNIGGSAFRTITLTTGLNAGLNSYTYSGSPLLSVGTSYQWYTYFKDAKSVVGASSAIRTLKAASAPTATITGPSEESNVTSNRVSFTYDYHSTTGTPQSAYCLITSLTETPTGVTDDPSRDHGVYSSGWQSYSLADGATGTVVMPSGYTKSVNRYRARLYVRDTDGVESTPDTQAFVVNVNAPPAMAGVDVSPEDYLSRIRIRYAPQEGSQPANFAGFRIYRRIPGDDDFTLIGFSPSWTSLGTFYDYYAGNFTTYEYMVVQLKNTPDDADLESPDSAIGASVLSADDWMVIGADRAAVHTFTLPVIDESHERPVQQEIFEPVGSRRKVIARGAVLGHEGSLSLTWTGSEASTGKAQAEYLYANRGPHILKSPFGDVWEVEFAGPSNKYTSGGSLSMSLSYIETSDKTSELG